MKTKFYPPSPVTKKTKEEKERADHEMDAKVKIGSNLD